MLLSERRSLKAILRRYMPALARSRNVPSSSSVHLARKSMFSHPVGQEKSVGSITVGTGDRDNAQPLSEERLLTHLNAAVDCALSTRAKELKSHGSLLNNFKG